MRFSEFPIFVKIAGIAQLFLAACAIFIWGAWATWGVFPNSLILSTAIFGIPAALAVASAIGLWRGKVYGWAIGILISGLSSVVLLLTSGWLAVIPLAMVAILLSAPVRGFYVANDDPEPPHIR